MVFEGINAIERLIVSSVDDVTMHFITMIKFADTPTFGVACDCDDEWHYEFYMSNNSDYERVKFNIMEAIFECEDMDSLMRVLSEVFEDGFADILIKDECDCDGSCENCKCKG